MSKQPTSVTDALNQLSFLGQRERRINLKEGMLVHYLNTRGMTVNDIAIETGINYRSLYYYRGVYRAVAGKVIPVSYLLAVGMKRAYLTVKSIEMGYDIRDYLNPRQIAEMTHENLAKVTRGDYDVTTKALTFRLTEEQYQTVYDALEKFGAKLSVNRKRSHNKEAALLEMASVILHEYA